MLWWILLVLALVALVLLIVRMRAQASGSRTKTGTEAGMRRREPREPGSNDGVDPRRCSHLWRDRAVTDVLGDCRAKVCDRCGALHIEGADEPSNQHSPKHGAGPFPTGGAADLESLSRRWSTGEAASSAD